MIYGFLLVLGRGCSAVQSWFVYEVVLEGLSLKLGELFHRSF
jgi:hypothetical protein